MRIIFKKIYIAWAVLALILIITEISLLLAVPAFKRWFWLALVITINIGWAHFWFDFLKENKRQKEIEEKFLEFIRNVGETVRTGVPIPKGILQVADKDYGALTPYVKKLGNQIEWGMPMHNSLVVFADDTENKMIKRSISIIIEADESGGDISDILESVSTSVVNIKQMKEERRSTIFSQIVQGYIVYLLFIGIMIILQLVLFPKLTNITSSLEGSASILGVSTGTEEKIDIDLTIFLLLMIQGFFGGLAIGKFSEGNIKNGLINSLILMTLAALIITTAKGG